MITKYQRLFMLISLGLLTSPFNTYAKNFYKWVDEEGNTHYASQPPNDIAPDQVIKMRSSKSQPTSEADQQKLDNIRSDMMERAKSRDGDNQTSVSEDMVEKIKKNCEQAKSNLAIIDSGSRIKEQDDAGETRYLAPEEIDNRKLKYQTYVNDNC